MKAELFDFKGPDREELAKLVIDFGKRKGFTAQETVVAMCVIADYFKKYFNVEYTAGPDLKGKDKQ